MKKTISRAVTIVLTLLLIVSTFFTVSSRISGGTPKLFGYQLMTVLSGSMEPIIQTGSIIAVKPIQDPTNLKVGDVVTYESPFKPGMLITHRIKEVRQTGAQLEYITKGDNNTSPDPRPIPANNVVAKYEDITIPYAGYALSFLQSKEGIALMLIVPGLFLVISQIFVIWRTLSRWEQEKSLTKNS
ncbi:signal peptidase I SipW [Brevibacillus sp. B_LB10_24]|uniref:signal peptidase I SipW n=1 Tax=Brevibacillus sp. B_LB10_24 TaxID=3380645 RepID=UPI0038BC317C